MFYGVCVSAFAVARVALMGPYGLWVDRSPYKQVFTVSLIIGMVASLVYALAPTLGIYCVMWSRFILGGTSAMSVATQAFVSSQTQKKDRTKYMSINTVGLGSYCTTTPPPGHTVANRRWHQPLPTLSDFAKLTNPSNPSKTLQTLQTLPNPPTPGHHERSVGVWAGLQLDHCGTAACARHALREYQAHF